MKRCLFLMILLLQISIQLQGQDIERNMMHMGIMFEKQAWQEVGGYREQMKHGREDWAFNVALGERGYCGVKLGRSGYLYRRHGHN